MSSVQIVEKKLFSTVAGIQVIVTILASKPTGQSTCITVRSHRKAHSQMTHRQTTRMMKEQLMPQLASNMYDYSVLLISC